jgi:uncharacterized protein (DUF952 family)
MHMSIILHIAHHNDWKAWASSGYYKPSSLDLDGFIHCSTIEQTVETANQYFANQQDLVLLCIDKDKLKADVRYEAPAGVHDQRAGSLFPHIYGLLNVSAVVRVVEFAHYSRRSSTLSLYTIASMLLPGLPVWGPPGRQDARTPGRQGYF